MKWKTKTLQNLPLFAINNYMFFLVLNLKKKKAEMVIIAFEAYEGIYFYRNPSFKCLCNIVPVQKNYMVFASSFFLMFRKTSLYQSICLK